MVAPLVAKVSPTKLCVGTPQLSVAVTAPVSAAGIAPRLCTVTFIGQVMTGGVVSCTVIVCVQVDMLPQASVAL